MLLDGLVENLEAPLSGLPGWILENLSAVLLSVLPDRIPENFPSVSPFALLEWIPENFLAVFPFALPEWIPENFLAVSPFALPDWIPENFPAVFPFALPEWIPENFLAVFPFALPEQFLPLDDRMFLRYLEPLPHSGPLPPAPSLSVSALPLPSLLPAPALSQQSHPPAQPLPHARRHLPRSSYRHAMRCPSHEESDHSTLPYCSRFLQYFHN